MDPIAKSHFLQLFNLKEGGLFEKKLDGTKAARILEDFSGLAQKEPAPCTCSDPCCPHKSSISFGTLFVLKLRLDECFLTSNFFQALENCHEHPVAESEYELGQQGMDIKKIYLDNREYVRQRVKFSTQKPMPEFQECSHCPKKHPRLFTGILEVFDAVEISEQAANTIKFIQIKIGSCFDMLLPVETGETLENGNVRIACPFVIPSKYLIYQPVCISFIGVDDIDLGYNFDTWIIGGPLSYPLVDLPPSEVYFLNHEGKVRVAEFKGSFTSIHPDTPRSVPRAPWRNLDGSLVFRETHITPTLRKHLAQPDFVFEQ